MIAPLLAALAVTATPFPPSTTVEESCDPQHLGFFSSLPAARFVEATTELERRIAASLAEERKAQADLEALPPDPSRGALGGALVVGAGLVVLGIALAGRRRAVGAVLVVAGTVVAAGAPAMARQSLEARATILARRHAMLECRTRLLDARAVVQHSRIAKLTHDLDEVGEDLLGWIGKATAGTAVGLDDYKHLKAEVDHSLRP